MNGLQYYDLGPSVEAFSTTRDAVLPYPVVQSHQVHGTRIARVPQDGTTREELEGYDAMITNVRGVAIGARTADCIPVLLYDPVNAAIAAVHSGWRGTVKRISSLVISRMGSEFGTRPEDLKAVIGPGICKRCFQVGAEVVDIFKDEGFDLDAIYSWNGEVTPGSMAGGHHLDLIEANRLILTEKGVRQDAISTCNVCTYEDSRFFSARREGPACGRIINSIKLL